MRTVFAALAVLSVTACGGGDVCQEAIGKWNDCSQKATTPGNPVPKMAWNGDCADGVTMKTAQKDYTVNLKSWSERYVACKPDPMTCLCPGQAFLVPEIYAP